MKVRDLIDRLLDCDPESFVVINNELVNSIREEYGREKKGYMLDYWTPLDHGKRNAVRFTYLSEGSDGVIYERNY